MAGADTCCPSASSKTFLLCHKGVRDHWVSFWREQDQPWKWANGSYFSNLFVIQGEGACTYLNDENGASSQCYMGRRWICSKPDAYAMGNGPALEGGSK